MGDFVDFHTHHRVDNAISIFSHSLGEGCPLPTPPYSAGIHPWAVDKVDVDSALEQLRSIEIVAVGEIGLDKACNSSWIRQLHVFEAQVKIAIERQLPVIIHCVRAQNEIVEILTKYKPVNVIFHSYIGSKSQMLTLISKGYYISLSKVSLQSQKTLAAIRFMPLDKLFLESDASNVPIADIYACASAEVELDIEIIKDHIYNNYKTIFK